MNRKVMIGYPNKRNGREIREKTSKGLKACNVYDGKKEEF